MMNKKELQDDNLLIKPIGYIQTDFVEKFGIPRQGSLVKELKGRIVINPEFSQPEAFRGLEEFSHIWLLWGFSENKKTNWAATVTPPRLGGKKRLGVFATRAPYRPNNIGISCVGLESVKKEEQGIVLYVYGIDMLSNTPIYDIKPYIPYADCIADAKESFVKETSRHILQVGFPAEFLNILPEEKRTAAVKVLELDPRPAYDTYEDRMYGVAFAGYNITFTVKDNKLKVHGVTLY